MALTLDESGQLRGTFALETDGYPARSMRRKLATESGRADFEQELVQGLLQWQADSFAWEATDNLYQPLKGECALTFKEPLRGGRFYLDPVLFGFFDENPFKRETRNFPVDMPTPLHETYLITLQLASPFEFESVPESGGIRLPEDGALLIYQVMQMGPMLSMQVKLDVEQTYYSPEQYPALRQFFSVLMERIGQQIVIRQKS